MKILFSTLAVLVILHSKASAVFVELQLNTITSTGAQRANIEIANNVLQPFNIQFGHGGLFFPQPLGTPSYDVFSDPLQISLDVATPVGDLHPDLFQVSNFTGSWAAHISTNAMRDTVAGNFDIPLTITGVGATSNSFGMNLVGDGTMIADTLVQGQPFQIPFDGASIEGAAAAVPEPHQWLMFGLVGVGAIICHNRRSRPTLAFAGFLLFRAHRSIRW